jgi:hypothetical protein
MNDTTAALAVLTGLIVRLMIPILITAFLVFALTWLDRRWRSEAGAAQPTVRKPDCWKTQNCTAQNRKHCPAYASSLPCWQVFRLDNGYLDEKCLACPVLANAPVQLQA